ncbi:hypothetical protein U4T15_19865 [Klebsiella pneumoniae]
MTNILSFRDNSRLSLSTDQIVNSVPGFRTRADALKAGSPFGWRTAIRLERRFENIWVVGKKDFQPDETDGMCYDAFHLPLLRWENKDGKMACPVLKIRRLILEFDALGGRRN